MKSRLSINNTFVIAIALLFLSCEDFVEVSSPNNKLIQQDVFSTDATARSAMNGIYNQLFKAAFSNGSRSSVTVLSGLSADNIRNINPSNYTRMEFEENELIPDNPNNLYLWSSAYNIIYMANSLLEGVYNSENLSEGVKLQLEGEARFIRAFSYFYLVNLYGEIPLLTTTEYNNNQLASRSLIEEVYDQIINDLEIAADVLGTDYLNGERTNVNKYAATALLSRVNLHLQNWEDAESLSSQVIAETGTYQLLDNLNDVFLVNSKEAIWQISPIGDGGFISNTNEASMFLIHPVFSFVASIQLRETFVEIFEEDDLRFNNWISYHNEEEAFFAYKYKVWNTSEFPIEEYSMVLRLAEKYLIRAEARARQGNISGAVEDLDIIRSRAGLSLIADTRPDISQEELLDVIIEERRKELFAEWGHRWLDLKRINKAGEVLGQSKPMWEETDVYYPIPAEERRKNPNLDQNDGY